jgi:hypothetical protein
MVKFPELLGSTSYNNTGRANVVYSFIRVPFWTLFSLNVLLIIPVIFKNFVILLPMFFLSLIIPNFLHN